MCKKSNYQTRYTADIKIIVFVEHCSTLRFCKLSVEIKKHEEKKKEKKIFLILFELILLFFGARIKSGKWSLLQRVH